MEVNKTLGNIILVPSIQDFQQLHQMSNGGPFLTGAGTSRYFGGPWEERNSPKPISISVKSDGKTLPWLFSYRDFKVLYKDSS